MTQRKYIFRKNHSTRPFVSLVLLILIGGGLLLNQAASRREIKPLFEATPTATRPAISYISEARAHFDAGSLDAAIDSFNNAIRFDPDNGALYAEMARVLTYSSAMSTTDEERGSRLKQAKEAAEKAVELQPDDGMTNAIKAFAFDWYATYLRDTLLDKAGGEQVLLEADQAISKALVIDKNNELALIYYAEIMLDFGRMPQAADALRTALAANPNQWEAYRVNGLYLEFQADYEGALAAVERASELAPNMTFLYIKLGQSSRLLGMSHYRPEEEEIRNRYFEKALGYFDKAATLNDQLGIQDPYPYLGIGYTYAQQGEFFIATRNMERALAINPYSAKVYGDLGMVARQGKNYELAVDALHCAVDGCTPEVSCSVRRCNEETDTRIPIEGLSLNPNTVSYYFTYAALLSGLYVPNDPKTEGYCDTALKVISTVRAEPIFNDEPIYDSIMRESENICASYGFNR